MYVSTMFLQQSWQCWTIKITCFYKFQCNVETTYVRNWFIYNWTAEWKLLKVMSLREWPSFLFTRFQSFDFSYIMELSSFNNITPLAEILLRYNIGQYSHFIIYTTHTIIALCWAISNDDVTKNLVYIFWTLNKYVVFDTYHVRVYTRLWLVFFGPLATHFRNGHCTVGR